MLNRAPRLLTVLLPLLLAGCISSTISNLSPKQTRRTADGLYPLEVRWDSNERALDQGSLTPYVVVDARFFAMQRTPLTTNRWETLVPVPAGQRFLNYHFKFDYRRHGFGKQLPDSRLSPNYQLEIAD